MIHVSQVRKEIREKPCFECGERIEETVDFVLTFYRGEFQVLHDEPCAGEFFARGGPKNVGTSSGTRPAL